MKGFVVRRAVVLYVDTLEGGLPSLLHTNHVGAEIGELLERLELSCVVEERRVLQILCQPLEHRERLTDTVTRGL